MEIIAKIYNYIKENKVLISVIAGLVLFIVILLGIIYGKNNNLTIERNNLKAATEEIEILKTKNGYLLVEKQSYITNIKGLEKYLDISKKEIKDLQKSLGDKVLYISELEAAVAIQPNEVHDTTVVYRDSTFNFTFKFSDKWYNLTGNSSFDYNRVKTEISALYVDVPLKVGLTEDWKIFVTTPNPHVSFSDIDGALLDKGVYLKQNKVRRFGLSVYTGFNVGYDVIGRKLYTGPGVGVGVSWIIF